MMNPFIECPFGYKYNIIKKNCDLDCEPCNELNAEFQICGYRCTELTCENPLLEGINCPEQDICQPGCYCKKGYVRNLKTNLCIPRKSCPSKY